MCVTVVHRKKYSASYVSIEVKNIFKRIRLKSDVFQFALNFNDYMIEDGERPDSIAEGLYASAKYDWVVLLSANIVNVENEWPISEGLLWDIANEKYGENLNAVHHYETKEVKDSAMQVEGIKEVDLDLVFEPPWEKSMMSEAAKLELNL